ncbi:MAG: polyphosphate polymerase domain-containing protein [Verrucomicrobiales bacterium]|nr:polyphosphate polymerase domain-containing protein [Verrucomicrobiales bacterium]
MTTKRESGVYELKFRVRGQDFAAVSAWMRAQLRADPHGTGEHGDLYLVQSLYLDTPSWDVFHRRGSYARAKFRIRRYNDAGVVFLERKMKREGIVRKRRVAVAMEEMEHLKAEANGAVWAGAWFHHRLAVRRLQPAVAMSYERLARFGEEAEERFRMTLDRDLRAVPPGGIAVPRLVSSGDLFAGDGLVEVKFATALPVSVRGLVEKGWLVPASFSKYRTGVSSCGLVPLPPAGS